MKAKNGIIQILHKYSYMYTKQDVTKRSCIQKKKTIKKNKKKKEQIM